jgi:hypothetical protein
MKTKLILTLLLFLAPLLIFAQQVVDLRWELQMIDLREQHGVYAVGHDRERSIHAISEGVWHHYMGKIPFIECSLNPKLAEKCALLYLKDIVKELAKAGYPQNYYTIAAAYTAGVPRFVRQQLTATQVQYAKDVKALCEEKS